MSKISQRWEHIKYASHQFIKTLSRATIRQKSTIAKQREAGERSSRLIIGHYRRGNSWSTTEKRTYFNQHHKSFQQNETRAAFVFRIRLTACMQSSRAPRYVNGDNCYAHQTASLRALRLFRKSYDVTRGGQRFKIHHWWSTYMSPCLVFGELRAGGLKKNLGQQGNAVGNRISFFFFFSKNISHQQCRLQTLQPPSYKSSPGGNCRQVVFQTTKSKQEKFAVCSR